MFSRCIKAFLLFPILTYFGLLSGNSSVPQDFSENLLDEFYAYQGKWYPYINSEIQISRSMSLLFEMGVRDALTSNGKIAIHINSLDKTLTFVDKANNSLSVTLPTEGAFPQFIITPDNQKAAVVNYISDTVTIVDLVNFKTSTVLVERSPTSIAIMPSGHLAYVTNSGSSSLTLIDLLTLGTKTIAGPAGSSLSFIAMMPDGKMALIADNATNSVFLFNTATLTFDLQIEGFAFQREDIFPEIAVMPDGNSAWVTNTASNTVSSIIGLNSSAPIMGPSRIVQDAPNRIAITPDGRIAYISNSETNNVMIMSLSDGETSTEHFALHAADHVEYSSSGSDPSNSFPSVLDLGFRGKRYKNKFAAQTEYVNKLTWEASSDPTIVLYVIFRNGKLIAFIPADERLEFIDHARPKNKIDTYMLFAINILGMPSQPSITTVP